MANRIPKIITPPRIKPKIIANKTSFLIMSLLPAMMITHYDIINAEMELNYVGANSFKLKNKAEVILVNPINNKEKGDVIVTTGSDRLPVIASVSRSEVFLINEE